MLGDDTVIMPPLPENKKYKMKENKKLQKPFNSTIFLLPLLVLIFQDQVSFGREKLLSYQIG